jgi:hypothetical protein
MTGQKIGRLSLGIRRAPGWVLAGILAVTVLISAEVAAIDPGLHAALPFAVVVTAAGAAGIGLRRRMPLLGLALVARCTWATAQSRRTSVHCVTRSAFGVSR